MHQSTKQLLNLIWKNSKISPRVRTFGWRLLRRALPSGARAGKYRKHISKLCCRCGIEETDLHLFFTCGFAKAAWFSHPWYLKSDSLIANADSITQILLNMLNMNHPCGTLDNILTFLWCIWKARNDCLFNRKESHPFQIRHRADAINRNLEMLNILQDTSNGNEASAQGKKSMLSVNSNMRAGATDGGQSQEVIFRQGETIRTNLVIQGSKVYLDAAWKTKKVPGSQGRILTGLGVYCQIQHDHVKATVFIQASTAKATSPLHAEAMALLLAAQIAKQLNTQQVTFLTDNLTLSRAAAATKTTDTRVPWELREQIAGYKKASSELKSRIFHIKRDINGVLTTVHIRLLGRISLGLSFVALIQLIFMKLSHSSSYPKSHLTGNCTACYTLYLS